MKNKILLIISLVLCFSLIACSGTNEESKVEESKEALVTEEKGKKDSSKELADDKDLKSEPISVGVTSAVAREVFEIAKEELEKEGYTIDMQVFTDNNAPNTAVAEGSCEFNFYQHLNFLNAYNESQGTDLVPCTDKVYAVLHGVYSNKVSTVDEVTDGMKVGIPNDLSNRASCLKAMASVDLIKIDENVPMPTLADITENPKNLELIEMDLAMIPASYEDLDLACSVAPAWKQAGMDMDQAIVTFADEGSVVYLVTRPELKDSSKAKVVEKALRSQAVKNYLETTYPDITEVLF